MGDLRRPLNDDDRGSILRAVGDWFAEHLGDGVTHTVREAVADISPRWITAFGVETAAQAVDYALRACPGPDSRCGVHGMPTSTGHCAACDMVAARLHLVIADASRPILADVVRGVYVEPEEVLFALTVELVRRYVATGVSDLSSTLQAIAENLEVS